MIVILTGERAKAGRSGGTCLRTRDALRSWPDFSVRASPLVEMTPRLVPLAGTFAYEHESRPVGRASARARGPQGFRGRVLDKRL